MVECGLTWVRIGEFAWSRMEPAPGNLQLDWLDRAIDVLGSAGLKIILGTPTATPPRWMAEKHPDMFARDAQGHLRGFGSRRHYCFSHPGYLDECRRITEVLAKRYGANPHIAAWQTDNEYGCHDTVLSYSDAATTGFRDWLAQRYQSVDALNRAWGNVFWSMEYDSFDQINLPNLTVTEPNPSHAMDFRRFSSDQVVAFNRAQVVILRQHSSAPILHNYMGRITEFDHFDVGSDLDIATWDSYPLGFLEDRLEEDDAHKRAYAQQGDPDFQAAMEYVDAFNEAVFLEPLDNAKEWLIPVSEYVQRELRGINEIFKDMNIDVQYGNPIHRLLQPPTKKYPASKPHIDGNFITAFFSFNRHASGSLCVPKEFAGEPTNKYGYRFDDADVSKAVTLPGMSVYIMKIGQQVHCAAKYSPLNGWRILERKSHEFYC